MDLVDSVKNLRVPEMEGNVFTISDYQFLRKEPSELKILISLAKCSFESP
jgi:hypothetical protein